MSLDTITLTDRRWLLANLRRRARRLRVTSAHLNLTLALLLEPSKP